MPPSWQTSLILTLVALWVEAIPAFGRQGCGPQLSPALRESDAVAIASSASGCGADQGEDCLQILEVIDSKVSLQTGHSYLLGARPTCPELEEWLERASSFVAVLRFPDPATLRLELLRAEPLEKQSRIRARLIWPGAWLTGDGGKPKVHLGTSSLYQAWGGFAEYLRHHDPSMRRNAARALAILGRLAEPAIPRLLEAETDPDLDVWQAVREALDAVGYERGTLWRTDDVEELLSQTIEDRLEIEGKLVTRGAGGESKRQGNRVALVPEPEGHVILEVTRWFGRPYPEELGIDLSRPVVFEIPCETADRCELFAPARHDTVWIPGTGEGAAPRAVISFELETQMEMIVGGGVTEPWTFRSAGIEVARPSVELIDWGIYGDMMVSGSRPEPGAETEVKTVEFTEDQSSSVQTVEIPGALGTRFGIQVIATGSRRPLPMTVRVTHPEFRGRTVEEWSYQVDPDIPRFAGWSFDHTWELVAGDWTIELVLEGEVVAAKMFHVTPPTAP